MNIRIFVIKAYNRIKIELRNFFNPYFAPYRRWLLQRKGIDKNFTIVSNNCWGGLIYQYFGLPYNSPTCGLYFFAKDYIKFIYNIKEYIDKDLEFISLEDSMYCNTLKKYGGDNIKCPIARCGDIEIIFMHYRTPDEAEEKWRRRLARINWDNVIFKFAEMNGCTEEDLLAFEAFPAEKKVVFTHKDYGLKDQVVYREFRNHGFVRDDTINFLKYINIYDLLSGKFNT